MGRISNAWAITKSSWAVLQKDRELVAVPIVSGIAAIVVFAAIALPGYVLLGGSEVQTGDVALWLVLALAAVAATWVTAIGQATIVSAAAVRMDGGDPDLSGSFATARSRSIRLLEWAVLATVVSIVLDQIQERLGLLGRIVSWIGNMAFAVMSFLALPVIVFEDVGAIEGFKRSARMLRSTWGEQLTFNFGTGLVSLLAVIPGVVVAGALIATGLVPLQVVGLVVGVVWVLTVVSVTSALSGIFKTALYRFTKGLPVDAAYDQTQLRAAFRPRR